jgi:hypothetical protein
MLFDLQSIKTNESDCREKSTQKKKKKRNQGKKKVVSVPAKPKEKYNKCIYMQAMSKRLAFIAGAHRKKKKKKRIHSTRNKSKPCGPSTKPGGDLHLFSPRLHEKDSWKKSQAHHQISKEREIEQHLRRPMTTAQNEEQARVRALQHTGQKKSLNPSYDH